MAKVLLGGDRFPWRRFARPKLVAALRQAGHDVKVVATRAALYFFRRGRPARAARLSAEGSVLSKNLFVDDDEWPGREGGPALSPRGSGAAHRAAPLGRRAGDRARSNGPTRLAKLAAGPRRQLSHLRVGVAWGPGPAGGARPSDEHVDVAASPHRPNTCAKLLAEEPEPTAPALNPTIVLEWINRTQKKLRIVSPQSKRLGVRRCRQSVPWRRWARRSCKVVESAKISQILHPNPERTPYVTLDFIASRELTRTVSTARCSVGRFRAKR